MATYTPNLNLYKPDASDPFGDFREKFNDNMDILDNGGGGGGGGHTIYDENGSAMTQRAGLEFTGSVSVSDDSVNDKTIVDILGGNVYGAFFDPDRVIYSAFTFDEDPHDWIATEDCILTDNLIPPNENNKACFIQIDGKQVQASYSKIDDPFVYVRKGQTVTYRAKSGSTMKAYGILQGSNGIFAPVIYSDTERKIGVWRDNKPLYQKTVHISALPSGVGSPTTYAHNIPNIDTICDYEGVIHYSNGNASKFDRLAMRTDGTATLDPYSCIVAYVSKTDINVTVGANRSTVSADFTIRYTKTTDVAGSGDWTTDGTPTVHYSTNERVIGTWVDGKPVYERLIDLNGFSIDRDTWYSTNIPMSTYNIKSFVEQGSLYQDYNGFIQVFPCAVGIMASTYIGVDIKWDGGVTTRAFKYLKIRYTKTTD